MTPIRANALRILLAATALIGLAGCEQFPKFAMAHKVKIVPSDMPANSGDTAEDRLYAQAAAAIERREYDTALDALQVANAARPNDPRVLNALAVIYDKLGRFDLSTRYYDLAEKADPGSKVVAMNRRYSELLQRGAPGPAPDEVMVVTADAETGGPVIAQRIAPALPVSAAGSARPVFGASAQAVAQIQAASRPTYAPRATMSEDELYRRAVASIQRRAFGVALGDLKAAYAASPGDPRVLSALGVVYDWLGRFDLSAHYYDLAEAADPGSAVVAINRRYSRLLQRHGGAVVADDRLAAPHAVRGAPVMIATTPKAVGATKVAQRGVLRKPMTPVRETHTG